MIKIPNIIIYSFVSVLPLLVAILVYQISDVPDFQKNLAPIITSYVWLGLLNALLDLGIGREFLFKSAKVQRIGILRTTKELILYQLFLVLLFSSTCLIFVPPAYGFDNYEYREFCIIFLTLNFCAVKKLFELHFQSKRQPLTQAIYALLNAGLDVFLLVVLGLNLELHFVIIWSVLRLINLSILIYPIMGKFPNRRKMRIIFVIKLYFKRSIKYTIIMLQATFLKHYDKTIYFLFTNHPDSVKFALTHLILHKIFFVATAVSVNSMSEYAQKVVNFSSKKLRAELFTQRTLLTLTSVIGVSFYFLSSYIGEMLNLELVDDIVIILLIGGYIINSWSRTLISYFMVNSTKTVIYAYSLAILIALVSDLLIYNHFGHLGTFWFMYNATVFVFAQLYKMKS